MTRTGWALLLGFAACARTGETGVHGRVIGADGYPMPGRTVLIGRTPVVTDDNGAFSLDPVTVPYDVAVAGYLKGFVFQGVTRRDIVLRTNGGSAGAPTSRSAFVSGQMLGGAPPGTPGIGTVVSWGPTQTVAQTVPDARGAYGLYVFWNGSDTTQGSVHALQYREGPDHSATEFLAHAVADFTVDAGAFLNGVDLSLEPVGTRWLLGNLALPDAGWTEMMAQLELTLGDGTQLFLPGQSLDAGPYTLTVPSNLDLTATVDVFLARPVPLGPSQFGDFSVFMSVPGLRPGDRVPDLQFSDAPTLLVPAPGEALDGGAFRWRAGPGQLSQFILWDGLWQIDVTTSASSLAVPDLSALGVALDARRSIGWAVFGIDSPSSVDALVSPEAPELIRVSVGGPQQYVRLP